MDSDEKDEVSMLSATNQRLSHMNKIVSISIPVSSSVGFTTGDIQMTSRSPSHSTHGDTGLERKQARVQDFKYLLKSGKLGMCNDPYCTTCPMALKNQLSSGDANGRAGKKLSLLKQYLFGVINPHAKAVKQWNQFFFVSCLCAIFIDPWFFYLLSVKEDEKCIVFKMKWATILVVLRSIMDLVYLMHMLVQFRLAYVSPESTSVVVRAGDMVDRPREIALHYIKGFFFLDLFIVLPLPQIIVLPLRRSVGRSRTANYVKNLLQTAILVQYIPRLYRVLPLVAGQSPSGFIFESAWGNFAINLLTFLLAGHVVGSCWYLFGLQRVNQCFRDACHKSGIKECIKFIDCGIDSNSSEIEQAMNNWKQYEGSGACFDENGFPYGIYWKAVNLTAKKSMGERYIYSFFWGFQQISTLAGNQVPSYYVWEVLFTMAIVGLGLLLFALLIGNMQNFLQGLGRRRLEMSLRRRDVKQWMNHRRFPVDLRRKVQEAEHYSWAATRGVNEEMLMENLPEDLQRDIRRHLLKIVKKVPVFAQMDESILDAICERLRQKTYMKGGRIMYQGGPVTKLVFIVRGKMESEGKDGNKVSLSEGDVCGEELLTWCLEHSSIDGDVRNEREALRSKMTVECLTYVEAFVLRVADLEEVISLMTGNL